MKPLSLRKLAVELEAHGVSVDEKTLRNCQKRGEAPKEMTVAAWKPFLEEFLKKGITRKSLADLREEKLKEEIRLLKLKAAREEGKTIALADVLGYMSRLSAKWDQLLTLKLETEIPARLLGKDIVAARAEARAVHDEIREVCNAGIVDVEKELAP